MLATHKLMHENLGNTKLPEAALNTVREYHVKHQALIE